MNKRIKSLFLFCAFLYGYLGVFAQDKFPHDNLASNFTPSPNAGNSAYGKSISVDPYTGMLQAGFTLYSYKNASTGLAHNITIGYNGGGGIHVDDIASNIGLGWSLNTGGVITRTINDMPDELGIAVDTGNDPGVLRQYVAETQDGQIDNFFYSAGESSGKFVVGRNNRVIPIPNGSTKIQRAVGAYSPSSAPLDSCYSISYTVTLANGTRYLYSNFDCSSLNYNDTASIHKKYASSTWYLSMIISAFNRDTIVFDYTPVVHSYYVGTSTSEYIYNSGGGTPNYSYYTHYSDNNNRSRDMRLLDIKYPDGTEVDFHYSSFARLDLHSDNALDNITITNGGTAYGYKFQYSYINSALLNGSHLYPYQDYSHASQWTYDERSTRLLLSGFNLFSGGSNLSGYTFQYDSSILPWRGSSIQVDHWGFFSYYAGGRVPGVSTNSITLNRTAGFSTADVLNQINLPTGGNIQVQYEANNTRSTLSTNDVASTIYYKDSLYSQDSTTAYYNNDAHTLNMIERSPVALDGKTILVDVTVTPSGWPSDLNNNTQIRYAVMKWNNFLGMISGYSAVNFDSLDFATGTSRIMEFAETGNSADTMASENFLVPSSATSSHLAAVRFKVKYQYYYAHGVPTYAVGGVRVKRLIESDNLSQANQMVHEYGYAESDGITSSGIVAVNPKYDFNYTEDYQPDAGNPAHPSAPYAFPNNPDLVTHFVNSSATSGSNYTYQVYTDAAVNSLIFTHGSPVGYDRVTEYLGTSNSYKKKTVYQFTTPTATVVAPRFWGNILPFPTQPDLDFATGLPISVAEYNSTGKLLRQTQNSYGIYLQSIQDINFVEIKAGAVVYPAVDGTSFKKLVFYPVTGKVVPSQSTTTEYYAGGDSISNTIQYTYDTSTMVLKQAITTDSKGVPIVSKYYYPYDFSIGGTITTLKNKGIIYDPVRVEVWKDTVSPKLINANVATFQYLSDSSVKPLSGYTLTTTAPITSGTFGSFNNTQLVQNPQYFTQEGTLDIYDNKGSLLQTSQNGVPTSFIWAYKHKYPVAKVDNAKLSDIAYTSFEDGTGNWSQTSTFSYAFTTVAVTGNYAYSLYSGNTLSKSGLDPTKTYILSYWSNSTPPSVSYNNGGSPISLSPVGTDKHNGWTLYKVQISGASTVTLSGGISAAVLDELRLYPKGSFMTTSTYDPLFGITSSCDAANRTTYYEYDVFGRLKDQRNFDRNLVKVYDYKNQEAQ